ncbi:hypothetical protein L1987_63933 [Smallanthus sonchifolius]|uniref:Uncharacterized protein n=1 Tax=Smallanthus sonchifolius TaxID=185202 RepID=A0ACB9CEN8_9ASTR|nr:hypothetical protein L1987_63933 [Smallanthus sonchifolius]
MKENTNIKSERDMAMQRNEDLENMLKQLQLERDLQDDITCHDDEPIYDETPKTIPSIINKDEKLDSKQCNKEKVEGKILGKMSFDPPSFKLISQLTQEGYKEAEPMQNETEKDNGVVDINKLIKENNILDEESKKTPAGSRIGVSVCYLH